jgi:galactoside O-acetyltransferase
LITKLILKLGHHKRKKFQQLLIKKGILVVGDNSDINNLEIILSNVDLQQTSAKAKIVIGKDCIIHGKVTLYSEAANIIIGDRVYIGPDTQFFCYDNISIGDDILFSWGITVIDTNAHAVDFEKRKNDVINWMRGEKDWTNVVSKPVVIKSKSWIGFNSIITKGVTIKEESIVSCGSVVVKDVEANSIVGGNPAEVIKFHKSEEKK